MKNLKSLFLFLMFIFSNLSQGSLHEVGCEDLSTLTHTVSNRAKNALLTRKEFRAFCSADDSSADLCYEISGVRVSPPEASEELRLFESTTQEFDDPDFNNYSCSIPKDKFLIQVADLLQEEERILLKVLPFSEITPEKIKELGLLLKERNSFFGIIATHDENKELHVTPLLIRRKRPKQKSGEASFQIAVLDSVNLENYSKKNEPFLRKLRDSPNITVKVVEGSRQVDIVSCRVDALYLLESALKFFRDNVDLISYFTWKRFFDPSKTKAQKNLPIEWVKGAQLYEKNKSKEATTQVTDLDGRRMSLKEFRQQYKALMHFTIFDRGLTIVSTAKDVMAFYPRLLSYYLSRVQTRRLRGTGL